MRVIGFVISPHSLALFDVGSGSVDGGFGRADVRITRGAVLKLPPGDVQAMFFLHLSQRRAFERGVEFRQGLRF